MRRCGFVVYTLADIYGEARAQEVQDPTWLRFAGEEALVVLCKDDRIRRRPAEHEAVAAYGVRAFCLTNGNLKFSEQATWFVTNIHRIEQASRKPGPYIYGVYRERISRLWPTK